VIDRKDTILVLDDEPEFLDWLEDFLLAKGYRVLFVTNIAEALKEVRNYRYRAFIVDLNVPASGEYLTAIEKKGPIYSQYHGLYAAEVARNAGYRDRQVVVYSVHAVPAVKDVTDRLFVAYLAKGRPHIFKEQVMDILSYDPSDKQA